MQKVSKLWGNGVFQSLTKEAKLLYIFLSNNPFISPLGIVCTNLDQLQVQIGYSTEECRTYSRELVTKKLVHIFRGDDTLLYFVVLKHLSTISNSQSNIVKTKREYDGLSENVKAELLKVGITKESVSSKFDNFSPPTVKEVEEYARSRGYVVNGTTFISHYEKPGGIWKDAKGKRVLDWKAKVRKIWCRDENKIPRGKDAPKNFEFFFVRSGEKFIFATHWVNGEPRCKEGLVGDRKLLEEYINSK